VPTSVSQVARDRKVQGGGQLRRWVWTLSTRCFLALPVLKEILADGPMAAGNVKRQAATAGVAERILHRARQALGVTTRRQGFGQGAF
jgi:hypothetical protein